MWTISYKGFYIHGYCDRDECKVQLVSQMLRTVKSLHAAKCLITKLSR